MTKNRAILEILIFTVYCLLVTGLCGCASMQKKERILAIIDGEPITEEDFKYALTISHRREDLSSAGSLDLRHYVQKLIDDRLIIQEARKSRMETLPEIQKAVAAYILRESVVRLHDEEIVEKVSLTDEEIKEHYRNNYERFTIGYIEVESEEKANEVLGQLKNNRDFKQIAMAYSLHPSKEKGGEIILLSGSMTSTFKDVISRLQQGEVSGVINDKGKYFIVKLIERKEAQEDEFSKLQKSIEKEIRKKKEKERSDKYLQSLREKMDININRELLSEIELVGKKQDKGLSLTDEEPLVEINGETLSAGEFMNLMASSRIKSADDILNNWIERKLIDIEALNRHYEKDKDMKEMIRRYEDQLLKKTFIERVIIPQITVTEDDLTEYYTNNQSEFLKPSRYRIQQITVNTFEEASEIEKNLKNGADFSWIAKMKSSDFASSKGGDVGWVTKKELPEPFRNIIDYIKTGEISPVTQIGSHYMIIKVQEMKDGEIEEFEKVKNVVYTACFEQKLNKLLEKYTNQLRQDVQIKIYEDTILSLEEKLKK